MLARCFTMRSRVPLQGRQAPSRRCACDVAGAPSAPTCPQPIFSPLLALLPDHRWSARPPGREAVENALASHLMGPINVERRRPEAAGSLVAGAIAVVGRSIVARATGKKLNRAAV